MSGKGKHRKWSAPDKPRIVLTAMQPGVEVSEVCRREGLNPVLYYKWKKQRLGSASPIFEDKTAKPSRQEERREAELHRLKHVIAEITAENLELKKGLSD
jgi:transposase-like protein